MEGYVIGFNQQLWPQIMLHWTMILIWLIAIGFSLYIAVLVIKALRRAIVALDIYIERKKKE